MNQIASANDLIKITQTSEEIVLFPLGVEGDVTLEYLQYTNLIKRICCLATFTADSLNNTAQKFDHGLPLIPLENLLHFRESAVIVVAVPARTQDEINQFFMRIGFQKIVSVNSEAIKELQEKLNKLSGSGQALSWFINHFMNKLTELEYRIEEQNEICAVNTETFAEYRNCFRGKKITIFGSGPTSKYYKPSFPATRDSINIGLNFSCRRDDILFNYLFIIDSRLQNSKDVKIEDLFSKIRDRIFVGRYSKNSLINYLEFSENIPSEEKTFRRYFLSYNQPNQTLYQNICCHALADFSSVSFSALHFALFTYPKEIYLVGCDTSRTGHFYDDPKKVSVNDSMFNVPKMKAGYARMKMFAKQHYPDTEIISINPVGLKGLFRDVYTDEYKASLN